MDLTEKNRFGRKIPRGCISTTMSLGALWDIGRETLGRWGDVRVCLGVMVRAPTRGKEYTYYVETRV